MGAGYATVSTMVSKGEREARNGTVDAGRLQGCSNTIITDLHVFKLYVQLKQMVVFRFYSVYEACNKKLKNTEIIGEYYV